MSLDYSLHTLQAAATQHHIFTVKLKLQQFFYRSLIGAEVFLLVLCLLVSEWVLITGVGGFSTEGSERNAVTRVFKDKYKC